MGAHPLLAIAASSLWTAGVFHCDAFPSFYHSLFVLLYVLGGFSLHSPFQDVKCYSIWRFGNWLGQSKSLHFFPSWSFLLDHCFDAVQWFASSCMATIVILSMTNKLVLLFSGHHIYSKGKWISLAFPSHIWPNYPCFTKLGFIEFTFCQGKL